MEKTSPIGQKEEGSISEASMSGRLCKALREFDPVRVENRVGIGTPDVNLSLGDWIENKWMRKAPKRGGILRLDHDMTPEQRVWHLRRHRAGGRTWVMLKISNTWILLKGYAAAEILGKVTLEELKEKAEKVWERKLVDCELRHILTKD